VFAIDSEGGMAIDYVEVTNIHEPFTVVLAPSTTDLTEDPVTIHVAADSDAPIAAAKWLPGEYDPSQFAEAGNEIDLDTMSFDVTENGIYTVYVVNEDSIEVVEFISVENIIEREPAPMKVTFDLSRTDPTD